MTPSAEPPTPAVPGFRRETPDRRQRPTPMLSRYLFVGRRRGGRREGERERVYVDRPGPWVIAGLVALVVLCVADAVFTLAVLGRGGAEANPVMRAALELGNVPFVVIKTLATVAGGIFLCLHKNWPLGRVCLAIALCVYVVLTGWHLYGLLWALPR